MLATLDWIIIIAFIALSLAISLYYRSQAGKSLSDFFLGGRNLPWYIAGISMVATTFAADTPLAVTELVVKNGISGNWIWWNALAGGMLTVFFFARLWRRAEVLTEVELIELRYSGTPAAILRGFKAVYLGLFMNVLIIGWVNLAMISILQVFFGLSDAEAFWYTGAALLIAAIYSSLSGLKGVAITDVVQFVIAMFGTVILAVLVVGSDKIGGITGLKEQLLEKSPWALDFFPSISNGGKNTGETLAISIGAFLAFSTMQWWASWYPGAEPGGGGYVAQRMMSAKDEKNSIYATLFFQVAHYCLRPWPWILVGLCTIILYPDLVDPKEGYVMAMKDFLPVGFKGLLLVAFLAAYMSTISTQLNWGASYLVNDLYKRFLVPEASQSILVNISRLTTILLGAIGLGLTTYMNSISGVWEFIIECGAGLGLVLILRWYWWRINAWSEITATLAPFAAYAFSHFVLEWKHPDSFFLTVGFTTVAWLLVTYLTEPTSKETLINFYKKVRPDGVWGPVKRVAGLPKEPSQLFGLVVCWISALVFTYSILFLSGKVIFQEWTEASYWLLSALISLLILLAAVRRTRIFQ